MGVPEDQAGSLDDRAGAARDLLEAGLRREREILELKGRHAEEIRQLVARHVGEIDRLRRDLEIRARAESVYKAIIDTMQRRLDEAKGREVCLAETPGATRRWGFDGITLGGIVLGLRDPM